MLALAARCGGHLSLCAVFGSLVARYQEAVYAVVWSMIRDSASTEDIAQEAFITACTRLSELRDPGAFPAWLRRIAVNAVRMEVA